MRKFLLFFILVFMASYVQAAVVTTEVKDVVIVEAAKERGLENPSIDEAQKYYSDLINQIIFIDAETNFRKEEVKKSEVLIEQKVEDKKEEWDQ